MIMEFKKCFNKVTLIGNIEELTRFYELFKKDDYFFSFNVLRPVPIDLVDIRYSHLVNSAIAFTLWTMFKDKENIALEDIEFLKKYDPHNNLRLRARNGRMAVDIEKRVNNKFQRQHCSWDMNNIINAPITENSKICLRTLDDFYNYGKLLMWNTIKYGFSNEDDWKKENWGTLIDSRSEKPMKFKSLKGNKGEITFLFITKNDIPNTIYEYIINEFEGIKLLAKVQEGIYDPIKWIIKSTEDGLLDADVVD